MVGFLYCSSETRLVSTFFYRNYSIMADNAWQDLRIVAWSEWALASDEDQSTETKHAALIFSGLLPL